jgi:hypothetical protein
MNALKHGLDAKSEILPNESPADRNDLAARFHLSLAPATPEERNQVNAMIQAEWLSRRYSRIEAAIWNEQLDQMDSPCLAAAFIMQSSALSRVNRHLNAAHRNFHRASRQFHTTRHAATKRLNPKLVSFRISANPAPAPGTQPPPPHQVHHRMRC